MAEHNELGTIGEEKSAEYLISKGYILRHRNWRSGKYELDIVAEKDDMLVIVEVKTRKSNTLLPPTASIDRTKMRNSIYAANAYIQRFNINKGTRFDIISVWIDISGNVEKIEHLEDAFLPYVNW